MQYIAFLSVLGLAGTVAATGDFFQSCPVNELYYGTLMSKCGANKQYYSIDLNLLIGNDNGRLVWGSQGFQVNCASNAGGRCDLDYAKMTCDCATNGGGSVKSTIDLNEHIAFVNDELVYQ